MTVRLSDFGSYTCGGRTVRVTQGTPVEIAVTRTATITHDPRGDFAVAHAYVQYFIPERPRDAPPVVLVHGGGLHGSTWETTPDGRPGWLHLLLAAGHRVHVVDLPERGRAGFAPGHMPGAPILRSLQDAWSLFRIGPPEGFATRTPHPGSQFPAQALDALGRACCPRWIGTAPDQAAALAAVLDRLGEAVVLCHSQGAEIAFDAAARAPGRVAAVIAVEPSALPDAQAPHPPTLIVQGDFLADDAGWRDRARGWADFATRSAQARLLDTARSVAPGGSHMLMMDRHNADCLAAILDRALP